MISDRSLTIATRKKRCRLLQLYFDPHLRFDKLFHDRRIKFCDALHWIVTAFNPGRSELLVGDGLNVRAT